MSKFNTCYSERKRYIENLETVNKELKFTSNYRVRKKDDVISNKKRSNNTKFTSRLVSK